MKINEESLNQLLKRKYTLKKYINYSRKFYGTFDPGFYLYRLLIEFPGKYLSDAHIELVYITLKSWNIGSQKVKLIEYKKFNSRLSAQKELLQFLRGKRIELLNDEEFIEVFKDIKGLYSSLKISTGNTRLIKFSQALHFLLPDLIMPVDGEYTLKFFYGNSLMNDKIQYEDFLDIHKILHYVAAEYELKNYLDDSWNKNIPKVFDNAIAGFVKNILKR
jgi:hypothetical protein